MRVRVAAGRLVCALASPGWLSGFGTALVAVGCQQQASAPLATPSGEQTVFAERYPERLAQLRSAFNEEETWAKGAFQRMQEFPAKLRKTDYNRVIEVVTLADGAGRSSAYSDQALGSETVSRFFAEEKAPLRQKVAGSVIYVAKEKECTPAGCVDDLGSTAASAMERAVDKQLMERLSRHNEASRYIENHQDDLGKQNLSLLEKQAAEISRASYLANVRLALYQRELEQLLDEAGSVETTLNRSIEDANVVIADAAASKTRKATAQKRLQDASAARETLASEVDQARAALEQMEQKLEALALEYETALNAVLHDLGTRGQQQ